MSATEFALAKQAAASSHILIKPVLTRRWQKHHQGRFSLRDSVRLNASAAWSNELAMIRRRTELPRIVVLCDISGSMERYARLFLFWVHALARQHHKLEVFTLGTRLSRITSAVRARDVDEAMALAGQQVQDWSGGTKLAACLQQFNQRWARRLLTARSMVILLSDGLDRDDAGQLSGQAKMLRLFAPRIVWLNPLLRFDGFEPKASGIKALLPYVDCFIPAHNLNTLADLSTLLGRPDNYASASRITSRSSWN
jgi:uncharacterized protein